MELSEFLQRVEQNPDLLGTSVVALQGETAPALFLSRFFAYVRKKGSATASIAVETSPLHDSKASLEVSFLGTRQLYWIKGVEELQIAPKKLWMAYVKAYQGPHCIVLYDRLRLLSSSEMGIVVEVPQSISRGLYDQLSRFLYPEVQFDAYFAQTLFRQRNGLGLDDACMMLEYHRVVGRRCEDFFKDWFGRLIIAEKSLFTMAQHFLAQQPKLFFHQWKSCVDDYSHEFWIVYWSELLWQAALFIIRAQHKGHAEAKKVAWKLPFSFINKDWQRYSAHSFIEAHRFLYACEYGMKQGERSWGLELFFHKFLHEQSGFRFAV